MLRFNKALAKEVITFIHGIDAYNEAVKITEALFSGRIQELSAKEIEMSCEDFPRVELTEDTGLIDLLCLAQAAQSKREARTFITGGGVSVNGEQIKDLEFVIKKENAIEGKYTILRRGKKNYFLIEHK